MLKGATYICSNKDCLAHNKELWLNPTWPIGRIEDVIASRKVQAEPSLLKNLQRRQAEGTKYALIQMPNDGVVKYCGVRFFLYCPKCHVIWQRDVPAEAEDQPPIPEDINKQCEKCQSTLEISDKVTELPCPHCDQPMQRRDWFVQGAI